MSRIEAGTAIRDLPIANDDPQAEERLHQYLLSLQRHAKALVAGVRQIKDLREWQRGGASLTRHEKLAANFDVHIYGVLCEIRRHTTTLYGTEEKCQAFDERLRPLVETMRAMAKSERKRKT